MLVGNDVSEFQKVIDFDTYHSNSNFVIIRATIGTSRADAQFQRNKSEARRVGLPRGFYHFSYPMYNSPEAEANFFLSTLNDIQDREVLFLDFEPDTVGGWGGDHVDFCKRFLDTIYNKTGYRCLIYLNQSQIQSKNWKSVVDGGYGLWVAAYYSDPAHNYITGAWPFAAFQQWTSSQQVPGIAGNVDGDRFFGDVSAFYKYGFHKRVSPSSSVSSSPSSSPSPSMSPSSSPSPSRSPSSSSSPSSAPDDCSIVKLQVEAAKTVLYGKGWPWTKVDNLKKIFPK